MFQATRRRLALWYTTVTAILLLLFASGFYLYVRHTLVERIDDTLSHVAEVVQRSLILEAVDHDAVNVAKVGDRPRFQVNIEASFPSPAEAVEDDHIDLEWFSPSGELLWSTFSAPLNIPLHPSDGETVYGRFSETNDPTSSTSTNEKSFDLHPSSLALRQITHRVTIGPQELGYLRVSHPWFEVTTPSRRLIQDLSIGTTLTIAAVAAIGWFLSGLAIAPVRDSYQRLKQFTADASHELRNPIAVIQTNVQVALADPDPQLQQDQLKVVERLTRRLGRLVDDLLFLARQDSGMTPLKLDTVDLEELIQEVIEEQQSIAADKILTFLLKSPDSNSNKTNANKPTELHSPYVIQGDRDQLTRLFTNLISNAVQYTPASGQIEVSLQRLKHPGHSQIQIQIKDTGVGIPSESLAHIFDRFYRVDPARTTLPHATKSGATAGSGLGLAIAKVIVENHQGQISVTSTLNQGTTFCVSLPSMATEA
jgi:OmpR-family two-component system manganese-sensing sensor histidine kinase